MTRTATCRCGRLTATCEGDPVRVSVCHCLACQKRTGSAFSAQARWPDDRVRLDGEAVIWSRVGDDGNTVSYRFCPVCGSTIAYAIDNAPGVIAIPLGAFGETDLPPPRHSVYEHRKKPWVEILGDDVTRRPG